MGRTGKLSFQFFLTFVATFLLLVFWSISQHGPKHNWIGHSALAAYTSKNAYVSLLTSTAFGKESSPDQDKEDNYFIAARLLAYQLLHAPTTRSETVPFILLVTEDVPERQRERLRLDGVVVTPIDSIHMGSNWPKPLFSRYENVLSKLRLFSLEEYDRVLFLDLDTIIARPLDAVFNDEAAKTQKVKSDLALLDEKRMPGEYVYAGVHDRYSSDDLLNSGFFIAKPSKDLMNYYIDLINHRAGKFDGAGPDQDMFNYAHRKSGPMPWTNLNATWNVNFPKFEDWEGGAVHSIQEKWWNPPNSKEFADLFLSLRWQMEGYFQARDQELGRNIRAFAKTV